MNKIIPVFWRRIDFFFFCLQNFGLVFSSLSRDNKVIWGQFLCFLTVSLLRVLVPAFVRLQLDYRCAQAALNPSLLFLPLSQYTVIPRHEITARDADNPCVFPVMGTWVLSVLQMQSYIYSLSVKLFATVSPHSSLKLTSHQPSATGKTQGGGRWTWRPKR